jgi:hypothetical protein
VSAAFVLLIYADSTPDDLYAQLAVASRARHRGQLPADHLLPGDAVVLDGWCLMSFAAGRSSRSTLRG